MEYQFRPGSGNATVHKSEDFNAAVKLFLSSRKELQKSDLYVYDAIEIGAQYLGLGIDDLLLKAEKETSKQNRFSRYQNAINLMVKLDKLLASHPNYKLENWVELARKFGNTEEEKELLGTLKNVIVDVISNSK